MKTGAPERWHELQVSAYEHGEPTEEFEFDSEKHEYKLKGKLIRSVTQILKDMGEISEWSMQSERARDRGIVVHIAGALLPDRLDWATVDPAIFGYVLSLAKWFDQTRCQVQAQEQRVYLPVLGVAGTLDLRGTFQNGKSGTLYLQEDGSLAKFKAADTRKGWIVFVSIVNHWRWKNGK